MLGDALDNRFELQSMGDNRIASVKTLQFYESLQLGRGEWKSQVVLDDQNEEIKFDVPPDRNPCQVCRESMSKHLKTILEGLATNKTFFVNKFYGSVYCDKRVFASVVITDPESAVLDWCHGKRVELGTEQADVEQQFSNYVVAGGSGS